MPELAEEQASHTFERAWIMRHGVSNSPDARLLRRLRLGLLPPGPRIPWLAPRRRGAAAVIRLIAAGVQACALTAALSLYLAAAANPQPSPQPAPVTVRPASPTEDRDWQREQLEHAIDEARRADQ